MRLLRSAVAYFALVFAAGFAFGVVRTLVVAPAVGEQMAELLEMPFMLVVIALAARWTARGLGPGTRLGVGLIALGLVLAADVGVGVFLRGMSPAEALVKPDPVTGAAYYGCLLVFAGLPWWFGRRPVQRPPRG